MKEPLDVWLCSSVNHYFSVRVAMNNVVLPGIPWTCLPFAVVIL